MPTRLILILLGAAVLAAGTPSTAGAQTTTWRWPVHGPIAQAYRYREATPFLAGQRRGVVIAAPAGAEVRAACAGRVSFAGRIGPTRGRGVTVVCGGLTATYLRLGEVEVRRGQHVDAGDRLGRLGDRGLHLGARVSGRRWAYVDPLDLLAGDPSARGTPLTPAPRRASRGPWALGPAPVRERVPRWFPLLRPPLLRPTALPAARVPLVAWLGLGLLATAIPALGVGGARRRPVPRSAPAPAMPPRRRRSAWPPRPARSSPRRPER